MHQWYEKKYSLFILLLLPFSLLFGLVVYWRYLCYRVGLIKSDKAPIPVIVVGNITVGGSGKTPVIIALCQYLQSMGYRPGVISRGYGGTYQHPTVVLSTSDPRVVGDEPVLIARRANVPVAVAKKRIDAVKVLLANHDCTVLLSDDGLQHYALQRDIEIAVVKSLGNRFLLPAGPLREPVSRLKTVDVVIHPQLSGNLLVNIEDAALRKPIKALTGQCIHAVAGIADPDGFFAYLENLGVKVIPHPFPDHYVFTPEDLDFPDALIIVMTEKDAVKCAAFSNERLWCLPVEVLFEQGVEAMVLKKLEEKT